MKFDDLFVPLRAPTTFTGTYRLIRVEHPKRGGTILTFHNDARQVEPGRRNIPIQFPDRFQVPPEAYRQTIALTFEEIAAP